MPASLFFIKRNYVFFLALWVAFSLTAGKTSAAEESAIQWQDWSDKAFEKARSEHKLVLLDVRSAWCHWCHVMDNTTYRDKGVIAELRNHYVAVSVDQDSHPDISHRYEQYGWPATIIFTADGTEIVKRRGYIEPDTMKVILQESYADPEPNPNQTANLGKSSSQGLTPEQHDNIFASILWFYDKDNAGWGNGHKFLEPQMLEFALTKAAAGNNVLHFQSEKTVQASYNLIDPAWGGVYQYSDSADWKSPHFEKILSTQAAYIKSYALAYGVLGDAQYRDALDKVIKYLDTYMISKEGGFYTSQDADLSEKIPGKVFYVADDAGRKKLGLPTIDKHIYSSANGNMISALTVAYGMTGDQALLDKAVRAMKWIEKQRALPDGGYKHGDSDKDGPFFADTLNVAKALLDLYSVTADREWLKQAQKSAQYMITHFADAKDGGFYTSVPHEGAILKPYKQSDENMAAARFFNLLSYYTGDKALKKNAVLAFQNVSSKEQIEKETFNPGLLLVDSEIQKEPLHIVIVGSKDDAAAKTLFQTALTFMPLYKRTEWYDKREGKLPGSDIDYPELPNPAAFVCTNNACSLPMFDVKALKEKIDELQSEN